MRKDPCKQSPKHIMSHFQFWNSTIQLQWFIWDFLFSLLFFYGWLSFVWRSTLIVLDCHVIRGVALEPMILQKCLSPFWHLLECVILPRYHADYLSQWHLQRCLRSYLVPNIPMLMKSVDNSPSPQSISVSYPHSSQKQREISGSSWDFGTQRDSWDKLEPLCIGTVGTHLYSLPQHPDALGKSMGGPNSSIQVRIGA